MDSLIELIDDISLNDVCYFDESFMNYIYINKTYHYNTEEIYDGDSVATPLDDSSNITDDMSIL